MRRLSLLLIALFIAVGPALAQGIIRGTVTGEAGKPQSGVTVVFRSGSASPFTAATDNSGKYTSARLPAGTYTVSFFAAGYETQRYTEVPLSSSADIIVNAAMEKSGAWGSSVAMHRYVPVALVAKKRGAKYKAKLTGIYPGRTATVGISRARPVSAADLAEPEERVMLAPPHPEPRGESKSGTAGSRSAERDEKMAPASVSVGGSRASGTKYVVDGVAVSPGAGTLTSRRDSRDESAKKEESREMAVVSSGIAGTYGDASGGVVVKPAAHAGSLTSGEINDFSKWILWEDMSMDALKSYRTTWAFRPEARYTVLVKSKEGAPLCNARVKMSDGRKTWEALTDNTGKAELWYGMWDTAGTAPARLSAGVDYGGQHFNMPSLKPFAEGANILSTNLPCLNPAKLDVAFIVDATGSMQDEIDYLKAELRDILQKVKDSMPAVQVQTGAVFYRDLHDAYITRSSDLTADFSKTEAFIADNNADGGDDFPEALDAALEEGLSTLHWRADATTRLAFLVLDAPPHSDAETVKRMQTLTAQYAARGIRLIPVVCSGSDKSTEYLLRAMALATNGTYLFLTDHSGIGGGHTAPTTDKYDVEYLNGLIYRVIYNCAYMPACKEVINPQHDTLHVSGPVTDSATITWRYYPNPTTGILHIEHTHTSGYLLITDVTGKAILRIPADASGTTTIDLGQYPAGLYAIRYNWKEDQWVTGKFVVVH